MLCLSRSTSVVLCKGYHFSYVMASFTLYLNVFPCFSLLDNQNGNGLKWVVLSF